MRVLILAFLSPLVASALQVSSPQDFQVIQRDVSNTATVHLEFSEYGEAAEIRIQAHNASGALIADQTSPILAVAATTGHGLATLQLPAGGWYALHLQATDASHSKIFAEADVAHLGVGEIFVAAGQSNAAAGGEKAQASNDLVSAADLGDSGLTWRHSVDNGQYGTPWPNMANAMVDQLKIPVAIVNVACGGTEVAKWLPGDDHDTKAAPECGDDAKLAGGLHNRLVRAAQVLRSFRAVLWHQGESDVVFKTSKAEYYRRMALVINRLDQAASYKVNWFVANASYFVGNEVDPNTCNWTGKPFALAQPMLTIRSAQQVLWSDQVAFPGPDTDGLTGSPYRYPAPMGYCVHFSDVGLKIHGASWYRSVVESGLVPGLSAPVLASLVPVYRFQSSFDFVYSTTGATLRGYAKEGVAFAVDPQAGPSSILLNECTFTNGAHLLSVADNCEGLTKIGPLGYVSSQPSAARARPLYRVFIQHPTAFMSTLSFDEVLANSNYIYQGITGFAFAQAPVEMVTNRGW